MQRKTRLALPDATNLVHLPHCQKRGSLYLSLP